SHAPAAQSSSRTRAIPVWPIAFAAGVLTMCALPYLLSAEWGPPGLDRLGTFWFNHDFSQYQAAMREGGRSTAWLVHDHFSAETHAAILMYPLYVAAGKAAVALHVSDLAIFTALEWLGRLAVIGALVAFVATFIPDQKPRRLALLLAV